MSDRLFRTEADPELFPSGPTTGETVDAVEDQRMNEESSENPGWWSTVVDRGRTENWIIPSVVRAGQADRSVDPDFVPPDFTVVETMLEERGVNPRDVPDRMFAELGGVTNENELDRQLGRIKERVESRQMMEKLGGFKAIASDLASFFIDPAALAVDFAVGGATKGRLVKRLLSGGFRTTVAYGAIEGMLAADGETPEPKAVAGGFAAAFVLGAGAGAAFGRRADDMRPTDGAPQQLEVSRIYSPAEAAEAAVSGELPRMRWNAQAEAWVPAEPAIGARSVGAAQDPVFPHRPDHLSTPALDRLRENLAHVPDDAGIGLGLRFDLAGQMLKSESATIRRLGNFLVDQPVAKDRSQARTTGASTMAVHLRGKYDRARATDHENAFLRHLKKSTGKGKLRSFFAHQERENFNREVGRYIRSRGTAQVSKEVQEAAAAHQVFFSGLRQEMIRRGVRGADQIPSDPWYMPRISSSRKFNEIAGRVRPTTEDGVGSARFLEEQFAVALRRGREQAGLEVDEELNRLVARAYVRRGLAMDEQRSAPFSLQELEGFDLEDVEFLTQFLADQLDAGDFARAQTILSAAEDAAARTQRRTQDAATPDRLKQRLRLDEDYEFTFTGEDGATHRVRIADFFEDDIEALAFDYGRWSAGESALAWRGTSSHEMRKAVGELRKESLARSGRPDEFRNLATEADADMAEFALRAVMGQRPDNMGENARRMANVMKSAGFVAKMGSAFVNAIAEAFTSVAMNGPGRILRNMDKYQDVLRAASGKNPDKTIVRQAIMLASGLGGTFVRNVRGRRFELDTASRTGASRFNKLEDFMEGAKRTASYFNLLARVTDVTRDMTAVNALSQLDDILVRGMRKPSWWDGRTKQWGLSDRNAELIRNYLRSDQVRRGPDDTLVDLGRMPAEVHMALEDYVSRYVGNAIQEIDRGNLPRFMQHPIGSMIFQFRSFETASWVRHTLTDVNMRDSLGLQKLLFTSAAASMLYLGRMHFFFAGDSDEIERRATPELAMRTGLSYAVNVGILPVAMDTVSNIALGENIINPYGRRTSGLAGQLGMESVPSFTLADDAARVAGAPFRMMRGGDGIDGLTREEVQSIFSIVGLETLWFTRPIRNAVARTRPRESEGESDAINLWSTIGISDD